MNETDVNVAANPLTLGRVKGIARRQWVLVVLVGLAAGLGAAEYAELRSPSYVAAVALYTGIPATVSGQSSTGAVGFPNPVPDATGTQAVDLAAAATGLSPSRVSLSAALNADDSEISISATEPTPSEARSAVTTAEKTFIGTWSQQLNTLASSTAPQLAALRHQLQVLGTSPRAARSKGGSSVGAASTTFPTSSTVPASPLAAEIAVVTSQYSDLYSQEVQYQVAAQSVRPAQTGALAVSAVPAGKTKLVLIALGAGLLAGCGLALLRDLAFDRLTDPAEVVELTELPMLAELPTVRTGRKRAVPDAFQGRLGEAVRELRTALAMAPQRPLQTLLVTSAGSGEGKSFTAATLSIAWALSGARTLLVSSDLRHPKVERMLATGPAPTGLAQRLSETLLNGNGSSHPLDIRDGALDRLVTPTPLEHLAVLPSGTLAANPAELLGSRGMAELVEELREQFDIIIFDSPPVLAVADARLLSRYADGVLLVVASGQSRKGEVRRALHLLERSRANMVGFVLNRAARSGLPSYRYTSGAITERRKEQTDGKIARVP